MSANESNEATSLPRAELFTAHIKELQAALESNLPGYERLLMEIHKALSQDDEVVHLLKEEDIGTIVAALKKKTNVVLATAAGTRNKLSSGKSLKTASLDDII